MYRGGARISPGKPLRHALALETLGQSAGVLDCWVHLTNLDAIWPSTAAVSIDFCNFVREYDFFIRYILLSNVAYIAISYCK
jgi:hypothetical protein